VLRAFLALESAKRYVRSGGWRTLVAPRSLFSGSTMATRSEVRKIALAFPEVKEKDGHFAFEVLNGEKYRGFAWVWMERVHPKKPRVPNPEVLAVRVPNLDAKEILLMADERKFFTEPHYDGFPAVLVRLREIGRAELRELLKQAWATQAPKALLAKSGE
jgi:hypothetical protein